MVVQAKNGSPSDIDEKPDISKSNTESAARILCLLKKRNKSSLRSGYESLEVLRLNIQSYFNKQVDVLMSDFMNKFFQPAIEHIKENSDEKVDENQIKHICRNLLQDCVKMQYSNDTPILQLKSNIKTKEHEVTNNGTSLLHQALKRKITSEAESTYKRQFFITTTANNFNSTVVSSPSQPSKSSSSLLTSALTSPPKAMRPIFHLIPNRNLKSTHVELLNLLKQNSSLQATKSMEPSKASPTSAIVNTSEGNSQN